MRARSPMRPSPPARARPRVRAGPPRRARPLRAGGRRSRVASWSTMRLDRPFVIARLMTPKARPRGWHEPPQPSPARSSWLPARCPPPPPPRYPSPPSPPPARRRPPGAAAARQPGRQDVADRPGTSTSHCAGRELSSVVAAVELWQRRTLLATAGARGRRSSVATVSPTITARATGQLPPVSTASARDVRLRPQPGPPTLITGLSAGTGGTRAQRLQLQHVPACPLWPGASVRRSERSSVDRDGRLSQLAVIEYNTRPVIAYAGSAIFLHADIGMPTAGCVALPLAELDRALRWLAPGLRPAIVMGPTAEIAGSDRSRGTTSEPGPLPHRDLGAGAPSPPRPLRDALLHGDELVARLDLNPIVGRRPRSRRSLCGARARPWRHG